MRLALLLLFIAVPLIELAILIKIGEAIGTLPTIALVIVTAVIGTWVLQRQGLRTMYRLQESVARGEPPIEPVVDGMFLLMAGGFLLTPGIMTDAVGFALLVPQVRRLIASWGFGKLLKSANIHVTTFGTGQNRSHGKQGSSGLGGNTQPPPSDGPVIDGEFERVDEKSPRN